MFFIWLRKPRKTHTQFPEFENRGRLPAFFYSAITAIMTKSIQSLEIQSLCPTRLIYALKCLPRFHISALAKTICCENSQPACLQYACFLIQTSINISVKVLLLSWRPRALSWQQKRSQCKEALGWMSDLYGCHFAVTTKKIWLAGLKRTVLGHTANEVRGPQAPGCPFLIYSIEEDLKQTAKKFLACFCAEPPGLTVRVAPGCRAQPVGYLWAQKSQLSDLLNRETRK